MYSLFNVWCLNHCTVKNETWKIPVSYRNVNTRKKEKKNNAKLKKDLYSISYTIISISVDLTHSLDHFGELCVFMVKVSYGQEKISWDVI